MDHIEPLLNSLKDLWNHEKIRISFIDDGSKDSTVAFLKSKTSGYNNVDIHHEESKQGYCFYQETCKWRAIKKLSEYGLWILMII